MQSPWSSPTSTGSASPYSTSLPREWTRKPPSLEGIPLTWTPLAPLPPEQAEAKFRYLYEHNPCRLPCWWGITPGVTGWQRAWQDLSRFSTNKEQWEMKFERNAIDPSHLYFHAYFNYPDFKGTPLAEQDYVIRRDNFKIDYIGIHAGDNRKFSIPQILASYGKPKEIYLLELASAIGSYSVTLFLYYPQYGFMTRHYAEIEYEDTIDGTITACYDFESKSDTDMGTVLLLWSSAKEINLMDIARLQISDIAPETIDWLDPLQQISSLSVNDFYRKFAGITTPPCIDLKW